MTETAQLKREAKAKGGAAPPTGAKPAKNLPEHIVEVISDSGEGAQKCGQSFGSTGGVASTNDGYDFAIPAMEARRAFIYVAADAGSVLVVDLGARRVVHGGRAVVGEGLRRHARVTEQRLHPRLRDGVQAIPGLVVLGAVVLGGDGTPTFDFVDLLGAELSRTAQFWLFGAFALAFASLKTSPKRS